MPLSISPTESPHCCRKAYGHQRGGHTRNRLSSEPGSKHLGNLIIHYTLLARTFSIEQLTKAAGSHQAGSSPERKEGFLLVFQRSWVQHQLCSVVTGLLCDLCRVSTLPETPLRAQGLQIQSVVLLHFFFFKTACLPKQKIPRIWTGVGCFRR